MARFRDLSIRSKLMTGFMLTSLVALIITMAALALFDRETFKKKMLADLTALAGVVGENSVSPLVFNDRETARSVLGALRAQPHVTGGFLFDNDHHLFASYTTPNGPKAPAAVPADGSTIDLDGISVVRPVFFNGTAEIRNTILQPFDFLRRHMDSRQLHRLRIRELLDQVLGIA